jgi:hypothetical protein
MSEDVYAAMRSFVLNMPDWGWYLLAAVVLFWRWCAMMEAWRAKGDGR